MIGARHQRPVIMRTKLTPHILLLGTSMSLSGCVSYAMRWKIPAPTVGDRISAAVVDVVTLPAQAVVIPALYGVDACQRTRSAGRQTKARPPKLAQERK
jgi:hypothetical protein